jgi:RNA polymerase sigma-70 factor (ECF subfamily)
MIQPNTDLLASCSFSTEPAVHAPNASGRRNSASRTDTASREKAALIDLVRRADANDPAAQSELVRRYTRRVAGFVRSIIRQPDAIEDVTQTIFIKMFRRLGRLRDPSVFESWLFALARNTCLDFLRRRRCRPDTVALDDQINQIADPSSGSATTEILAALDRALARLTPVDRTLVTQFVAGESYVDIAAHAGLSLATVKVRLHRVRPFLRTCVGEMTDTRQRDGKGWRCVSGSRTSFGFTAGSNRTPTRIAA